MDIITARMQYFNLQTPPPFADEKLLSWNDIKFHELEPFITERQRHGSASVNVFKVVGTRHPEYSGKSWLHLLENGKRMQKNLTELAGNPNYYQETSPKQPYMQYRSIDGGDVYIGDEGNHRTCIARFYFFAQGATILHGVNLLDYRIDWAMKSLCDEFRQTVAKLRLPIFLTTNSKLVERRDATNWMSDRYVVSACVLDGRSRETHEFDHDGLQKYLERLKKPWWKIWQAR